MNNAGPTSHFCPYIGLSDDADSSVAFPSNSNYCHRGQPAAGVRFNHQQEFCLGKKYIECPVFLREAAGPLPEHIRAHRAHVKTPQGNLRRNLLITVGALTAIAILGWAFINQYSPPAQGEPTSRQVIPPASNTPTFINLLAPAMTLSPVPPAITSTPTLHIPLFASVTATIQPTATPSITPIPFVSKHRLDVPIGTDRKFIIRRLAAGESLDTYIQQYSTSFKAVKALNYYLLLTSSVKRDVLVVFPIGFTNVSGMHVLNIYQIKESERGVNFEYVAHKLKVDINDFKYYNGITEAGDRPLVGDYYLVPLKRIIP
jgi:hypothetical protein